MHLLRILVITKKKQLEMHKINFKSKKKPKYLVKLYLQLNKYKLKKQKSKKFVYHNDETFRKETILTNTPSPKNLMNQSNEKNMEIIEVGLKKFNEIKHDWFKN